MFASLAVPLLLAAAPVSDAPRPTAALNPNAFMLDVGFASAVGFGGVTFLRKFGELAELELGIGAGYTGVQCSAMPKLTLGSLRDRFVLGVGPSVGLGGTLLGGDSGDVPWINAEVGFEHRSDSGFVFLIAAGTTTNLAPFADPDIPEAARSYRPPGQFFAQTRAAFGWSF